MAIKSKNTNILLIFSHTLTWRLSLTLCLVIWEFSLKFCIILLLYFQPLGSGCVGVFYGSCISAVWGIVPNVVQADLEHLPSNCPCRHTPRLASYLIWACACVCVFAHVEKCTFLFVRHRSWCPPPPLAGHSNCSPWAWSLTLCAVWTSNTALGRGAMDMSVFQQQNHEHCCWL